MGNEWLGRQSLRIADVRKRTVWLQSLRLRIRRFLWRFQWFWSRVGNRPEREWDSHRCVSKDPDLDSERSQLERTRRPLDGQQKWERGTN